MEESVLRLRRVDPFLNVVDDQHVDRLIKSDEVIEMVLNDRIGELYLEEAGTDIQHTFLWVEMLGMHADSVDEMGFSAARWLGCSAIESPTARGNLLLSPSI